MNGARAWRVVGKAIALFLVFNAVYAALQPPVGRLSIYNWLVKGRTRFPSDRGIRGYNVSLDELDAMFSEHVLAAGIKPKDEYRVVILGDSQTWGWTVAAGDSIVDVLNRADMEACGHRLTFYNLAYPSPSVLRDFVILHRALEYQPDLVVWMVTLQSFTLVKWTPTWTPFMLEDPQDARALLHTYGLDRYAQLVGPSPAPLERTIVGQRWLLAKIGLAQLDGLLWEATGIDNSVKYQPLDLEVPANDRYREFRPPRLPASALTFDVLPAAHRMIRDMGVLMVNQPIFLPPSRHADIRYNVAYPRWAFDQYREMLSSATAREGWQHADLYDAVPYTQFTNHDFHMTAAGVGDFADALMPELDRAVCSTGAAR